MVSPLAGVRKHILLLRSVKLGSSGIRTPKTTEHRLNSNHANFHTNMLWPMQCVLACLQNKLHQLFCGWVGNNAILSLSLHLLCMPMSLWPRQVVCCCPGCDSISRSHILECGRFNQSTFSPTQSTPQSWANLQIHKRITWSLGDEQKAINPHT